MAKVWSPLGDPGELQWIGKHRLIVDHIYQRGAAKSKVRKIADSFLWSKFGVITVSERADKTLAIIDGQHRAAAAMLRDDITALPCIVFRDLAINTEADAFVGQNKHRRPMCAVDAYRAKLVAQDSTAVWVHEALERHGITVANPAGNALELKAISEVEWMAATNRCRCEYVLHIVAELCWNAERPVNQSLMQVAWVLCTWFVKSDADKERLLSRMLSVGLTTIESEIKRTRVVLNKYCRNEAAKAVQQRLNRGLRSNKFVRENQFSDD